MGQFSRLGIWSGLYGLPITCHDPETSPRHPEANWSSSDRDPEGNLSCSGSQFLFSETISGHKH